MIDKITKLENAGVFNDFSWADTVKDENEEVVELRKLNIVYGRNYAGKTTLSRIIRSFETKQLPEGYRGLKFSVSMGSSEFTTENFATCPFSIRVFNEDFVRENLAFTVGTSDEIKAFAILGENVGLEAEISRIKDALGENDADNPTGLYRDLRLLSDELKTRNKELDEKERVLERQLIDKATGRKAIAIKYNENYACPNYNKNALNNDISKVRSETYSVIDEDEKRICKDIIRDTVKKEMVFSMYPFENLLYLNDQVRSLVEQPLVNSNKIEELVKDALLNRWVFDGIELNKNREKCAFCGSLIPTSRWRELESHFDQASKKLEEQIINLEDRVLCQMNSAQEHSFIDDSLVYAKYAERYRKLRDNYCDIIANYVNALKSLREQLVARRDDILNAREFRLSHFDIKQLSMFRKDLDEFIQDNRYFAENLRIEQKSAREKLRLQDVYEYLVTIKYDFHLKEIDKAKKQRDDIKKLYDKLSSEVEKKESDISQLRSRLNDESLGAEKVNEYLRNFFGHEYLQLFAEKGDVENIVRFKVLRNGELAINMSEGERRLLAFCYFMAKLQDVETKGKRPIVWIDDPICSLDGNHVFFVYSLILSEMIANNGLKDDFDQLIISTHSMEFLKYLKRLGKNDERNVSEQRRKKRYFIVQRTGRYSSIKIMPSYMVEYVTEFNYLFEQIYKCGTISEITSENYGMFYNFANNARKFLELYLFYRYPTHTLKENEKYKKFFGDTLSVGVLNRLENEYSHMCGVFERGEQLVDIPEMKKVAEYIMRTIKEKDAEQYEAFLQCVS